MQAFRITVSDSVVTDCGIPYQWIRSPWKLHLNTDNSTPSNDCVHYGYNIVAITALNWVTQKDVFQPNDCPIITMNTLKM